MGFNKREKREVVVRKNKMAGGRKNFIGNWETPCQEVLGSLHVNMTSYCASEGCYEGCSLLILRLDNEYQIWRQAFKIDLASVRLYRVVAPEPRGRVMFQD